MSGYEKNLRNNHLDLTHQGHRDWMRDVNPQAWNDATWRAYNVRMGTDTGFRTRAVEAAQARHRYADEQLSTVIGDRHVSSEVRMDFRRDLLHEAFGKFPRPDPWENGWQMPAHADPLSGIGRSPRASRIPRRTSAPREHDDSKGIEAARVAAKASAERTAAEEAAREALS